MGRLPEWSVRCFIAVQLSEGAKSALVSAQERIESGAPGFYRWTPRPQMHLTLYFLGDMEDVTGVVSALRGLEEGAFSLGVSGLVRLPEPNVPKILAGGVTGDVSQLERLQRRVSDTVFDLAAFKETRRYYPHVSIGRLKHRMPASAKVVKRTLSSVTIGPCEPFRVGCFELVESRLAEGGPKYEVVESFGLV